MVNPTFEELAAFFPVMVSVTCLRKFDTLASLYFQTFLFVEASFEVI